MNIKQLLAAFAIWALLVPKVSGQQIVIVGSYYVEYAGSLSASTEAITVHLPVAQSAYRIKFGMVYIYSSAACDWRTERDGTLPTATTLTPTKQNSYDASPVFTAFRSSNVGTATRVHPTIKSIIGPQTLDIGRQELLPGENLTIRTPSNCTTGYSVAIEVFQQTRQ